jgi:putative sigma-54 modulation protein
MEVRFVQRGTEIDAGLRSYMEGKITKLEKFFSKIMNSQVIVSLHKVNYNVETTVNANGVILRAEENATDPRRAFDLALKNLERQIKRHNSYLKSKGQNGGELPFTEFSFSIEGMETAPGSAEDFKIGDPIIEKVKKIPVYPMDPREAIMQMDLVGHSFFMFQNAETGDINVVYKRKDGNYGQLEPVK